VRSPTLEMTKVVARASAADGAHVLEVAVEDLDAVVALVGDVDGAVAVHRHVKGVVEMAVAGAGDPCLAQGGYVGELVVVNLTR